VKGERERARERAREREKERNNIYCKRKKRGLTDRREKSREKR